MLSFLVLFVFLLLVLVVYAYVSLFSAVPSDWEEF